MRCIIEYRLHENARELNTREEQDQWEKQRQKSTKRKKKNSNKTSNLFFFFIITISIYLLNTRTCYRGHRFFTRCANFDRVLPFISPKANWLLRTMKCRINFIFKFSLPLDNVLRGFLRLKMFLLLGNGFSYRFFDETISNFYPLQHVASRTRSTA